MKGWEVGLLKFVRLIRSKQTKTLCPLQLREKEVGTNIAGEGRQRGREKLLASSDQRYAFARFLQNEIQRESFVFGSKLPKLDTQKIMELLQFFFTHSQMELGSALTGLNEKK